MKTDIMNLEQEFGKLKKEMRKRRMQKAAMPGQRPQHEQEIRDVRHEVELLRQTSDEQK
jgi:ribosomal protein L29